MASGPGSYQATIHETALGSIRASLSVKGPQVFITGPQECTHQLTASEAREAAAALMAVAAEIGPAQAEEPAPQVVHVHVHGALPFNAQLHVDGREFASWLQRYLRMQGRRLV